MASAKDSIIVITFVTGKTDPLLFEKWVEGLEMLVSAREWKSTGLGGFIHVVRQSVVVVGGQDKEKGLSLLRCFGNSKSYMCLDDCWEEFCVNRCAHDVKFGVVTDKSPDRCGRAVANGNDGHENGEDHGNFWKLALLTNIAWCAISVVNIAIFIFGGGFATKAATIVSFVSNTTGAAVEVLKGVPAVLTNPSSWVININPTGPSQTANPSPAYWSGADRFWTTLVGYLVACLTADIYLHHGRPLSSSQAGQKRKVFLINALNQGSGVMKVILIIGIQILIFPLYCGLLLDVALLPLFENTTIKSSVTTRIGTDTIGQE
ncbi:hypothetical protein MGG_17646 [Pyricularia oryzae 70-15]|uniref:RING-type E3 ubiquitin transferase n=1 Tax=Pyricularia oryzae (strain 70-15 / ATCC MYA-4617 / FGSC 8958) TaxID=242507 RepID=G4NFD2_PYRO7|nr:uncharacterized protein MGG_17646 [Pyricularia oryzae 70-15]EHA47160.1 hypothetical protein MGG_17646 [Pyricularia oryzae 70-15]